MRVLIGEAKKDERHAGKITPADLKYVMLKVAEEILVPGAFTNDSMSLNASGGSCSVFKPESCCCDLYGWIVKTSYHHWAPMRAGRRNIGKIVSEHIDSHIRNVSEHTIRLMDIGDIAVSTGVKEASRLLRVAAEKLNPAELPKPFRYAGDYEDDNDKIKREAGETLSRAKKAVANADDKIPANVIAGLNARMAELKTARLGKDFGAIKSATQALSLWLMKMAEAKLAADYAAQEAARQASPQKGTVHPDVYDERRELVF